MSRPRQAIRRSQLITTFGPGAMVDLPRVSVLIGGLEHWAGAASSTRISEPRLSAKLAAALNLPEIELRSPPLPSEELRPNQSGVKAFRFPEWFLSQDTGFLGEGGARSRRLLHRKSLIRGRYRDADGKNHTVVPVRFVRACRAGHIDDIDWYDFAHAGTDASQCKAGQFALYLDERGTSSHLSDEFVRCQCGKSRSLYEATVWEQKPLGMCNGKRPWLGPASREPCHEQFRLLVRSASNAYFSLCQSVISLPNRGERLKEAVDAVWDILTAAQSRAQLEIFMNVPKVRENLKDFTADELWQEIEARRVGSSGSMLPIRIAELDILTRVKEQAAPADAADAIFSARALPRPEWGSKRLAPIERVVMVDRLREVVAQYGFTRFEPIALKTDGEEDDAGVTRAALATETRWLPAYENRGEGIFLQFSQAAMQAWLARPQVNQRGEKLMLGFKQWQRERSRSKRQFPGLPYILLHSLSHLLMTRISLRCGYPSAALRERIYAFDDAGYGILIYTGASDSEGTLGGLVEAGRKLRGIADEALNAGTLCSNDPVCAQHDPTRTTASRYLLGAACHGCLLLSETSCEMHNEFLDRALVVPTLEHAGAEMFPAAEAGSENA